MERSYPSGPVETSTLPRHSEIISLSGAKSSRILCTFRLAYMFKRSMYWCSVAIFDVVKSPRRTSPFVLLQPRLPLQDIIPTTSRQRDYPNVETAFVGLVPETGSLFALGPGNFPLVAFSGPPVSAQKVEGIDGMSEEGILISHEDGRLQCYEGTTDRRCQTGVRTLKADSASRIARLLDGVPSPAAATPPLPSATGGDDGGPGNTNSQAYAENEQLVFAEEKVWPVPWQWISSVPESALLGRASWAPSSSALLLTLASITGTILWFKRKSPQKAHVATVPLVEISVPDEGSSNPLSPQPTKSLTHILRPESPVVETVPGATTIQPENILHISSEPLLTTPDSLTVAPASPPATDKDDKPSLVKAEPAEGAEDAGEAKKKPRKRRRRRRGETKDTAAEIGDEPENDDGDVGEVDNVAVFGAPSLIIPLTPAPSPLPSLSVSENVLGTSLTHVTQNRILIEPRVRFAWDRCLPGLPAGPRSSRQTSPSGLCYPCPPRSQSPQRRRRPSKRYSVLLPRGP